MLYWHVLMDDIDEKISIKMFLKDKKFDRKTFFIAMGEITLSSNDLNSSCDNNNCLLVSNLIYFTEGNDVPAAE